MSDEYGQEPQELIPGLAELKHEYSVEDRKAVLSDWRQLSRIINTLEGSIEQDQLQSLMEGYDNAQLSEILSQPSVIAVLPFDVAFNLLERLPPEELDGPLCAHNARRTLSMMDENKPRLKCLEDTLEQYEIGLREDFIEKSRNTLSNLQEKSLEERVVVLSDYKNVLELKSGFEEADFDVLHEIMEDFSDAQLSEVLSQPSVISVLPTEITLALLETMHPEHLEGPLCAYGAESTLGADRNDKPRLEDLEAKLEEYKSYAQEEPLYAHDPMTMDDEGVDIGAGVAITDDAPAQEDVQVVQIVQTEQAAQTQMPTDYVKWVQKNLDFLGFVDGYDYDNATGLNDAATEEGIRLFQEAEGLEVTGTATPQTWERLTEIVEVVQDTLNMKMQDYGIIGTNFPLEVDGHAGHATRTASEVVKGYERDHMNDFGQRIEHEAVDTSPIQTMDAGSIDMGRLIDLGSIAAEFARAADPAIANETMDNDIAADMDIAPAEPDAYQALMSFNSRPI